MQAIPQLLSKKALFSLPPAVSNELEAIAKELHKRKSHIVTEALEMYFDHLDLKIAKKRYEDIKSGKETTVTLSEVIKELELQ
jgi:predicted DNA-binding protein